MANIRTGMSLSSFAMEFQWQMEKSRQSLPWNSMANGSVARALPWNSMANGEDQSLPWNSMATCYVFRALPWSSMANGEEREGEERGERRDKSSI